MECPRCHSAAPPGARYCSGCGVAFSPRVQAQFTPSQSPAVGPPVVPLTILIASIVALVFLFDQLAQLNSPWASFPAGFINSESDLALAKQLCKVIIGAVSALAVVALVEVAVGIGHYSTGGQPAPSGGERILLVCPRCRSRNPQGCRFCENCGAQLF